MNFFPKNGFTVNKKRNKKKEAVNKVKKNVYPKMVILKI